MTPFRRTKIIATLGPASSTLETIEQLFQKGANLFRLNLSHGTPQDHRQNYEFIREIESKHNTSIGVIMDLQGPKLRIGSFRDGPIDLVPGDPFSLTLKEVQGDATRVTLPHPEIFHSIQEGASILINDGALELEVTDRTPDTLHTVVIRGGELTHKKGVNLPNVDLPLTALTDKDKKDIQFALELGADYIGLSFVQTEADVQEARDLIQDKAHLIAKIEKPQALQNLQAIIESSDAILVARGDLGVELPPEEVPLAQKRIVHLCRKIGKPVAIATQMLESMIHHPRPTRAEVSDVANAVFEGADGVMLSAESASGAYPVEAVAMMDRILLSVEGDASYSNTPQASREETSPHPLNEATLADGITTSAVNAAHTLGSVAILSFTASGKTSQRLSRQRPSIPLISITPHLKISRKLSLSWGTYPVVSQKIQTYNQMVEFAPEIATEIGVAQKGDTLVITAGEPLGVAGWTNVLRIIEVT